jgi:hypothetical protein
MSYDPYAPDYEVPDSEAAPLPADTASARGRVQPPAICLIVVGVLNLFWGLYLVVNTTVITVMPAKQLQDQQKGLYDAFSKEMKAEIAKKSPEEMKTQLMVIYWPLTLLALLAAVLPLVGGVRMLSLRNYALGVVGAISAAISAAIPCLSGSACCGLGEGIGIWALVVLLNESVREAFR